MSYKLLYSSKADKQLEKMGKSQSKIIVAWMKKHIKNTAEPRKYGKALSGKHKNKWSYRIGQYRVLVDIQDKELIVLALEIGHRREIYR